MSKNATIGVVAAIIIAAACAYYFISIKPAQTAVSEATPSSAGSQAPNQRSGNDIDAITADLDANANAEATQANSENGTESASQFNSAMDSQTVYGE